MKKVLLLYLILFCEFNYILLAGNPYADLQDIKTYLTNPKNLKQRYFVCRIVNINSDSKVIGMKSIVYPLIDFEAMVIDTKLKVLFDMDLDEDYDFDNPPPPPVDSLTFSGHENKLGEYWETTDYLYTHSIGSEKTKGYNYGGRMLVMAADHWLKSNPVELLPDTYIGNMIPAKRVVIIPPLMEKMYKEPKKKWEFYCKTFPFKPGQQRGSLTFGIFSGINMQGPEAVFLLSISNKIKVTSEELKTITQGSFEEVLKKDNKTNYVARLELMPAKNLLFVDIVALVPMNIYIKDKPNMVDFPDKTKRISLKTLDCSQWKWTVKADGKVIYQYTGPAIKFPELNPKKSQPWMLRHELIGRKLSLHGSEIYIAMMNYFRKKGRDKKCTLSVTLPLYIPNNLGKIKKVAEISSKPITVTYQQLIAAKQALIKELKNHKNKIPQDVIDEIRNKNKNNNSNGTPKKATKTKTKEKTPADVAP